MIQRPMGSLILADEQIKKNFFFVIDLSQYIDFYYLEKSYTIEFHSYKSKIL